jgi:hypothetical protein
MHTVYDRVFLGILLFILISPLSALAADPSADDIEDLLGIMESPTKREAFTKNLKNLLEAKKAMDGKKAADQDERLFIVRLVFEQFDEISRDLQKEAIAWALMVEELPEAFSHLKSFFLETKNRPHLRILLLDAAAAIVAMLIFTLFLRLPVRSVTARMKTLPSKIGWGFVYIILKSLPFVVLFIVFDIMFRIFPSFSKGRTLVLLLFTLLFLYRLALAIFHVLLSPEEAKARLLDLSDENANYLWIWVRRFALYGFFYFMTTRSLLWTQGPQLYLSYLRAILLLPFPLMLTVFVFQLARELRVKHQQPATIDEDIPQEPTSDHGKQPRSRITAGFIRSWPVLATGYVWAFFLTLMINFEKGFEYLLRATLGTILTTLLIWFLFHLIDLGFIRFFQIQERTRQRFPGLEQKANRYLQIVRKGLKIAVGIVGLGTIGQIWGIPVSALVTSEAGGTLILRALAIAITVAVVAGLIEVNNTVAAYLLKEKRGAEKERSARSRKPSFPSFKRPLISPPDLWEASSYWNGWGSTPPPFSPVPALWARRGFRIPDAGEGPHQRTFHPV